MFTTKEQNTILGLIQGEQTRLRCNPRRDMSSAETKKDLAYLGRLWSKMLSFNIDDRSETQRVVEDMKL